MKTNAIVRIILYSLAILILTWLLLSGLARPGFPFHTEEEVDDIIYTSTAPTPIGATVVSTATLYSAPHPEADALGTLKPGDKVTILRQESVADIPWALTADGWILMASLEAETTASLPQKLDGSGCSIDPGNICEINIEWVVGDIYIAAVEGIDQIQISESHVDEDKYLMNVTEENGKLTIQFCRDGFNGFGINLGTTLSKDLTICVPADWVCRELQLEVASANVTLEHMQIGNVDFDGASGTCDFVNCTVGDLDIDTASGDVTFFGSLTRLDFDAASASFNGNLTNCPSEIDMDGMSGDLELTLPQDCGFTVTMDGLSSHFSSDFAYETRNGNYICGDGRCRISVDGMSSDVYIHKAASAPVPVPEASAIPSHHTHTESCITNPDTCPEHTEHHPEH